MLLMRPVLIRPLNQTSLFIALYLRVPPIPLKIILLIQLLVHGVLIPPVLQTLPLLVMRVVTAQAIFNRTEMVVS